MDWSGRKNVHFELSQVPLVRGNAYSFSEGTDIDTIRAHSVEWMSVCSLLFYPGFCLPLRLLCILFVSSISGLAKTCFSLFWLRNSGRAPFEPWFDLLFSEKIQPGGRQNSIVKVMILGDQSMHRWFHFSTAITQCNQYLLQNDKISKNVQ